MTGTKLILDRLKAKKGIRRRVSLLAIALDLAAILTAYTVASLAYLNTIAVELILRTLVSLWPIFFLFALNLQIYNSNLLAERFRSSWRASSALIWASLLMSLIFFFLKISEEFSRAVLGLGTAFAVALITFGRFGIAQLTNGILGATPGAYLQILDGTATASSLNGDALSADELGLEPIPSDPEMLDRLGQLAFGLDGVVVHCAS